MMEKLAHLGALFPCVGGGQVLDPNGGVVFEKDADAAHFSFTTENGGEFQFCFHDITDQSTARARSPLTALDRVPSSLHLCLWCVWLSSATGVWLPEASGLGGQDWRRRQGLQ